MIATPAEQRKYFKIALFFVVGLAAVFISITTVGSKTLIARIALGVATSITVSIIVYFIGLEDHIELYSIGLGSISIIISIAGANNMH